jgi:hypothetical protein
MDSTPSSARSASSPSVCLLFPGHLDGVNTNNLACVVKNEFLCSSRKLPGIPAVNGDTFRVPVINL